MSSYYHLEPLNSDDNSVSSIIMVMVIITKSIMPLALQRFMLLLSVRDFFLFHIIIYTLLWCSYMLQYSTVRTNCFGLLMYIYTLTVFAIVSVNAGHNPEYNCQYYLKMYIIIPVHMILQVVS